MGDIHTGDFSNINNSIINTGSGNVEVHIPELKLLSPTDRYSTKGWRSWK